MKYRAQIIKNKREIGVT